MHKQSHTQNNGRKQKKKKGKEKEKKVYHARYEKPPKNIFQICRTNEGENAATYERWNGVECTRS